MRLFLTRMISGEDRTVDELILLGLAGTICLLGFEVYDVLIAHHPFNVLNFGTSLSTIMGSMGIGGGVRNRLSPPPPLVQNYPVPPPGV